MTNEAIVFSDRADAGRQLAAELGHVDRNNTVVVALPRGGVPVAEVICDTLHLPMDLVFVRKIGAPGHAELAIGAIVDAPEPYIELNQDIARAYGVTVQQGHALGEALLPEIERRKELYLKDIPRPRLAGKTLVVVDDGVATGATLRASLHALRAANPGRIIVALPVAPPDTLRRIASLADEVVCLSQPRNFAAVGGAYLNFSQVSDDTVIATLRRCSKWLNEGGQSPD